MPLSRSSNAKVLQYIKTMINANKMEVCKNNGSYYRSAYEVNIRFY